MSGIPLLNSYSIFSLDKISVIFSFSSSLKLDIVFIVKSCDKGYPASCDVPAPNKKPILLNPLFKVGIISLR